LTDFGRLMRSHLEQVLRQTDIAKVAANHGAEKGGPASIRMATMLHFLSDH
jgi:hypothetical protein